MSKERVFITGASSGIGMELARIFARNGFDLVILARREDVLRELAEELEKSLDINVKVLPGDLSSQDVPAEIYRTLNDEGVQIDYLVNNAGFGTIGPFHENNTDTLLAMINVNLTSLALLTRYFLPPMVERNSGGVLNVGSLAGFQPGPNAAVYYATKAFVLSLTEAIHEELKSTGVKVSCLCPGPVETEFGSRSGMEDANLFRTGTIDVSEVARQGFKGLMSCKDVVIPGLLAKTVPVFERFIPRKLIRKIASGLNKA